MKNLRKTLIRGLSSLLVCCLLFSTILPLANALEANETNLAKGKDVKITSSSDYPGMEKNLAIDGNINTRWASGQTSETQKQRESLKIDLGSDMVIDAIRIHFENPAQEYIVKLTASSNDPKGEYTRKHKDIKQGTQIADVIECNGVEARYIEFIGIEQARFKNDSKHYTPWGYSIREFEVIQRTNDPVQEELQKAVDEIKLADKYYGNEVLPLANKSSDVKFQWTSNSNNFKIDPLTGKVTVASTLEDQSVSLSVKATKNGKKLVREFQTMIGAAVLSDSEYVDKAFSELTLRSHANKSFNIPLTWFEGVAEVNISWKSDSPNLVVDGGQIIVKPASATVKGNVTATLSKGDVQREKTFTVEVTNREVLTLGIFPEPQCTLKLGGKLNLANVTVEYKGSYDSFLKDHAGAVFGNAQSAGSVKVILATEAEKDQIAEYLSEDEYSRENSLANYDGYIIKVDPAKNAVVLLGKDQSALYNAVTTLKLLKEKYNNEVDGMFIEDYADVEFRGFIEGFYGSWTQEQRKSLVANLSQSKMNTYIYGSKSDVYHRNKWRELYPESAPKAVMDLQRIRELVDATRKNNMTFVWGIHAAGINFTDPDEFDKVVAKYDQLYNAGVRQFAIFFDDGGTNFKGCSEFINRLNREYIQKKPGVKDLIYCPQGYNYKFAKPDEWAEIKKFDKDIQVMFTGTTTMSELNEAVLQRIEKTLGRRPYIWWNYPVNDLDMSKELVIGPLVGLDKDMTKLPGLASNPMFQAESSKVALYSIADFLWNKNAFDSYKSWENAIDTMIAEPEIREAYKLFALNVSIMGKQEFAFISEESEYLAPLFDTIVRKYRNGEDCRAEVAKLQEETAKLRNAIQVLNNSKDKYSSLINEMQRWLIKGEAVVSWLQDTLALVEDYEGGNLTAEQIAKIGDKYLKIRANIDNTNGDKKDKPTVKVTVGGKVQNIPAVNFGQHRILPFIYDMTRAIESKVTDKDVSAFGNLMFPGDNALDKNTATQVTPYGVLGKYCNFMRPGLYFGVDLGSVKVIQSIHFVVKDLAKGNIEISTDMENWEKIGEISASHPDVTLNNINKKAKYVRIVLAQRQDPTMHIAEMDVNGVSFVTSAQETACSVELGTQFDALNLPTQVKVMLSNGQSVLCDVQWNAESYNADKAGKYSLKGEITVPANVSNIDGLTANAVVTVIDKTQLKNAIGIAKDMIANKDKYVSEHWDELVKALADAEKIMDDGNATAEEINAAADALTNAISAQRLKADKAKLQELIAKADALDLTGFTEESVEAFNTALHTAKDIMADESLSEDDQVVVDAAVNVLSAAIEKLEKKEDGKDPIVPPEPDPTEPDATEPNTTEPDTTEPDATKPDHNGPAETGDKVPVCMSACLALLSLLAVTATAFWRKNKSYNR